MEHPAVSRGSFKRKPSSKDDRDQDVGDVELAKKILNDMAEGCQIISPSFKYIYLNRSAIRHSQKTAKQLLGKTMMECYPGIEKTELFRHIKKTLKERVLIDFLNEFRFPNNKTGWFEIRIEPVPYGVMILSLDVTERLKMQRRISRRQEHLANSHQELEKLKEAVDSASDAIIITDEHRSIVYANKACIVMTGYKSKELIDKDISIIWGEPTLPEVYRNIWSECAEKGKFSGLLRNIRKDGRAYDARLTLSPVLDKNDKIVFYVALEHDMAPEEEVDRIKGDLMSLVAHQLRTAPNIISWSIESLVNKNKSIPESDLHLLNSMAQANRRMVMLIDTMLNISRSELGTLTITPQAINLPEIIDDELKELQEIVELKKIKIVKKYPQLLTALQSDESMLRIIFHNLLSNAVRYSKNNGKVTIEVVKKGQQFSVVVADRGCGIPKKQQVRVFTKLFRADNARLMDPNGNGLGLYLTKLLVGHLHGQIEFTSKIDKGTTFWVNLPAAGINKKEGSTNLLGPKEVPTLRQSIVEMKGQNI